MKHKNILSLILSLMLILGIMPKSVAADDTEITIGKVGIEEYEIEDSSIPDEIALLLNDSQQEDDFNKVRAWEVDLFGNITEVVPLSQRENSNLQKDGSRVVPDDGFIYVYNRYDPTYVKKDWTYSLAGESRTVNGLTTNVEKSYEQQSTKTTNWTVSASIEGNGKIGADFLAKVEFKIGGSVARSTTTVAGWKDTTKYTVRPNEIAVLKNYHVGVNADGANVYDKYSPSGTSLVGIYYETAGGTALVPSSNNIVLTLEK